MEIQLLLDLYLIFKKLEHKIYDITRASSDPVLERNLEECQDIIQKVKEGTLSKDDSEYVVKHELYMDKAILAAVVPLQTKF